MEKINKISGFPAFVRDNWAFIISISNEKNILIMASEQKGDYQFIVKFFVNEAMAYKWVKTLR
jgi:hypothetical protein